ncbi:hypothetical protein PSTG_06315 [Puccinia striiformis f. sp. tritici PST-78]|uniref:Uncharacterized protein n=1 Tax=Puccinia striiformis f. sp. tritici PST-78 TaxID=1165861 RepID=A0A0L0VMY6_9BASI|nr:hypothetical protein PSTG_06315 [Puccinia striiformis f. sp. tritici PST-78]
MASQLNQRHLLITQPYRRFSLPQPWSPRLSHLWRLDRLPKVLRVQPSLWQYQELRQMNYDLVPSSSSANFFRFVVIRSFVDKIHSYR